MPPKKKAAAEPKGSPLKKAKKSVASWEWKDGTSWKAYADEDSQLLEHLFATVGEKGKVVTTEFSFNQEL
eukprot:symbB.v1.2.010058.t1/scaffold636.1/size252712/13